MKIIKKPNGIMDINRNAIIIHQVNCQNRIGAGLSGAIITKYPKVEAIYHKSCEGIAPKNLLGKISIVREKNNLTIVNVFGQLYYGNSAKTDRVYTDYEAVKKALHTLRQWMMEQGDDREVYAPEFFGCGLAGGDWDKMLEIFKQFNINIVHWDK